MTTTEKILFTKGIRPTVMRLKIYKYLKRKTYALTLKEMQNVFVVKSEKNKTANKTTFYRAIKLFEEKRMVHQIDDGTAIAKYAVSDENTKGKYGTDLHMHFHCTDCRKTICLPNKIPEESLPDEYEVNNMNLVLIGICKKCREK
ncbi:Fur family transcriptional regulator [Gillisia sp. Hel1_33_143]|uniref:Fur family transcriptional regulator n=1 Tax=Gillisia sp. Hel1_33_143 TaxID=1336796 RepID=UPI000B856103|nr:transcriptional repressor [Gillisia sp. Hel1_33_143]